jgi:hypothetical protein
MRKLKNRAFQHMLLEDYMGSTCGRCNGAENMLKASFVRPEDVCTDGKITAECF